MSLKACNISAKDLFYHRKNLLKHGLIIKQPASIRVKNINTNSLLFHLPRFYTEYRPAYLKTLHAIITYLKTRKDGLSTWEDMLENCGQGQEMSLFRSYFKKKAEFSKVIKAGLQIPYSEYYPDSNPKQWKAKNGNPRMLRVMRLLDMDIDPDDIYFDRNNEDESMMEEDDENDNVPDENVQNFTVDRTKV